MTQLSGFGAKSGVYVWKVKVGQSFAVIGVKFEALEFLTVTF